MVVFLAAMDKVGSAKYYWFLGLLLIVVLFVVFIYPGVAEIGIAAVFQFIFKILAFLALCSFITFLIIEFNRLFSKSALSEKEEASQSTTHQVLQN